MRLINFRLIHVSSLLLASLMSGYSLFSTTVVNIQAKYCSKLDLAFLHYQYLRGSLTTASSVQLA